MQFTRSNYHYYEIFHSNKSKGIAFNFSIFELTFDQIRFIHVASSSGLSKKRNIYSHVGKRFTQTLHVKERHRECEKRCLH